MLSPLAREALEGSDLALEVGESSSEEVWLGGDQGSPAILVRLWCRRAVMGGLLASGCALLLAIWPSVAAGHTAVPQAQREAASPQAVSRKYSFAEAIAAREAKKRASERPANVHDELELLGRGRCIDYLGKHFAGLGADDAGEDSLWRSSRVSEAGASATCESDCLRDPECNGYATRGSGASGRCALVKTGNPSDVDGAGTDHCFWKHRFLLNSSDPPVGERKQVPKIVWGFWQNMPPSDGGVALETLPPLIDLCVASWRQLNPDWEVRLLNESSKLDWITTSDLPDGYEKQPIQRKSDSIRIALLAKYGGVWIDATNLLLRPLVKILPSDPSVHFFMNLRNYRTRQPNSDHEGRANWTHFVENWFMAATPQDLVMTRIHQCVLKLYPKVEHWLPLALTGMFSPVQVEMLNALHINTYLSMHSCFLKTITDDVAVWHWYNGPHVVHMYANDAGYRVNTLYGFVNESSYKIKEQLFLVTNKSLLADMTEPRVKMLKIRGSMRNALWDLTTEQLWCTSSTFHMLLASIGLKAEGRC